MRLTLRVLLAYRDQILEPADMEDVGLKLRESDFASNLNARIDALLKAHADDNAILNKNFMLDANSIAEYLDNVMHAENVPALERVCLENDAPLAEVSFCDSTIAEWFRAPSVVSDADEQKIRARVMKLTALGQDKKG